MSRQNQDIRSCRVFGCTNSAKKANYFYCDKHLIDREQRKKRGSNGNT